MYLSIFRLPVDKIKFLIKINAIIRVKSLVRLIHGL